MFAIAKKLNMTQVFTKDGQAVSVTVLEVPKNQISKFLTEERDGYQAVQVKAGKNRTEFRVKNSEGFKMDQEISVADFKAGEHLKVTGTSKGRGFAGFIKRHGFSGMPQSHGHERQRIPGSIGQAFPQHVRKGMKMAGQMGNVKVTEKSLFIVAVDEKNGRLFVKGSTPGPTGGFLKIVTTGKEKDPVEVMSFDSQEKKTESTETAAETEEKKGKQAEPEKKVAEEAEKPSEDKQVEEQSKKTEEGKDTGREEDDKK